MKVAAIHGAGDGEKSVVPVGSASDRVYWYSDLSSQHQSSRMGGGEEM